ncbi:hypothetical protein [uncultured Rhodoblastus sp.]|uniref:hypothetical protein n=1 Tax=uncultured Rhodoblastus sp. TaxID=543037 RepID=UPI002601025B|nr:hypothetical protein [uncultured Rhodoblastus sp.]
MAGQHEEYHRQSPILIMQRPRRSVAGVVRIARLAGAQCGEPSLLRRDDDKGDIGRHDRRQQRAEQRISGATGEKIGEQKPQSRSKYKERDEQEIAGQPAFFATEIVGQPDRRQQPEDNDDRRPGRRVPKRGIDQIELRRGAESQAQLREADGPGRIGLLFEVQGPLGGVGLFGATESKAAASMEQQALRTRIRIARTHGQIEPRQREGGANPDHGCDHVQPARRDRGVVRQQRNQRHRVPSMAASVREDSSDGESAR